MECIVSLLHYHHSNVNLGQLILPEVPHLATSVITPEVSHLATSSQKSAEGGNSDVPHISAIFHVGFNKRQNSKASYWDFPGVQLRTVL
jgi:hypothetical protein